MSRHTCLPTAAQEQFLHACFDVGDEAAAAAFREWRSRADLATLDRATTRFVPLLHCRLRGSDALRAVPDSEFTDFSGRVYLTIWRQNHEFLRTAVQLHQDLERAGVGCLFLKGIALVLRHAPGMRCMGDVDVLVHRSTLGTAVETLVAAGWRAQNGATVVEILQHARVRHAWQFSRGEHESCDLHWRPMARGYSPAIDECFWEGAEAVPCHATGLRVPNAADQLLLTCVHRLEWDWRPSIRWVADSLMILRSVPDIDWQRV